MRVYSEQPYPLTGNVLGSCLILFIHLVRLISVTQYDQQRVCLSKRLQLREQEGTAVWLPTQKLVALAEIDMRTSLNKKKNRRGELSRRTRRSIWIHG